MARKSKILLVTHLLALVLGYGVVRKSLERGQVDDEDAPEFTKLANRDGQAPTSDGEGLLADFLNERTGKKSRYADLKATLPVAKDLKGAVVSAVAGLGGADWRSGLTRDGQAARVAEVEVRVLHWMKQNPHEAMGFILNDRACEEAGIPELLNRHVIIGIATENGVLASVGWLARDRVTFGTLCAVALNEMRAGGGFALYEKLAEAIWRSSGREEFLEFRAEPLVSENPADDGERFLRRVGAATRFEERDSLLAMVRRIRGTADRTDLLAGFAGSSVKAAEWLRGIQTSGELKGEIPRASWEELNNAVLEVAGLDLEQRLEILKQNPDFDGRPRNELVEALVAADVRRLLENGRDWRFEFRTGKSSLDDVWAAVRHALPAADDEAARVNLFRELAEEDAKRALPLLDALPPEKRRNVLLDTTWQSFANVSPDDFLGFLAEVPDAGSPEEQDRKLKGWNTKVRANLWRYGDDYIEWVKQLPPGIHREAAMNSVLVATAGESPAQARALSEQFYPSKP